MKKGITSPTRRRIERDLRKMVDNYARQDDLDRIKEDIRSTRALFLVFAASVLAWAVAITLIVRIMS